MQVNVIEYFENYLKSADPESILLVDGSRSFTCRQIEQAAKRCAQAIIARTLAPGELVAVFLPRCAETVFADLGILYSGNIYTNIDTALPDQRIANIFSNLKPGLVIATRQLGENLGKLGVPGLKILFIGTQYQRRCNMKKTRFDTDGWTSSTPIRCASSILPGRRGHPRGSRSAIAAPSISWIGYSTRWA